MKTISHNDIAFQEWRVGRFMDINTSIWPLSIYFIRLIDQIRQAVDETTLIVEEKKYRLTR
jgi:hypothetical protein